MILFESLRIFKGKHSKEILDKSYEICNFFCKMPKDINLQKDFKTFTSFYSGHLGYICWKNWFENFKIYPGYLGYPDIFPKEHHYSLY